MIRWRISSTWCSQGVNRQGGGFSLQALIFDSVYDSVCYNSKDMELIVKREVRKYKWQ